MKVTIVHNSSNIVELLGYAMFDFGELIFHINVFVVLHEIAHGLIQIVLVDVTRVLLEVLLGHNSNDVFNIGQLC